MDTILQGMPHIACCIDENMVTGKDDKDHLHTCIKSVNSWRKMG
jgi:hypothetical protein